MERSKVKTPMGWREESSVHVLWIPVRHDVEYASENRACRIAAVGKRERVEAPRGFPWSSPRTPTTMPNESWIADCRIGMRAETTSAQIVEWLNEKHLLLDGTDRTDRTDRTDGTHGTHGTHGIGGDASLQQDWKLYGDDIDELLEDFVTRFDVDMSGYLWYFHTGEEGGPSLGSLLFKPPHQRVEEIPITVAMLRDAANSGRWAVDYPDHEAPGVRYDLWIDRIFFFAFAVGLLVLWLAGRSTR